MKIKTLPFLLLVLAIGGASPLWAQVKKGSFLLQNGIEWNYTRDKGGLGDDQVNHIIQYDPHMGIFLSNRFLLGGGLQLSEQRFDNSEGTVLTSYGLDLALRLYLSETNHPFLWFLEFSGNYTRNSISTAFNSGETRNFGFGQAALGTDWFISEGISITSRLFYKRGKRLSFLPEDFSSFGLAAGIQYYFLPKSDRKDWPLISPAVGDYMIGGGDFSFIVDKVESRKRTTFSIRPQAGAFVSPHLMLGTAILLSQDVDKVRRATQKTQRFGFTPFVRYYPGRPNRLVRGFVSVEAGIVRAHSLVVVDNSFQNIVSRSTFLSHQYAASIGLDIFLTPNFALEMAFIHQRSSLDRPDFQEEKTRLYRLSFGFQYFICRRTAVVHHNL
ncbi:MAG: hypothetical protein AAFV95_25450 [Bacteroidota bacterium]